MTDRQYIAIDLKSFYASVECMERHLNPLTTNLVVADESRTEKTICLAVSPSLKAYGIPGRPRLFEVVQKVKEENARRLRRAPGHVFSGKSSDDTLLRSTPGLALDYIVAPPRMAYYIDYSTRIYDIYLRYIAPEDIHVYSIDEVFLDVTAYLNTYKLSAHDLAMTILRDVRKNTGITATAGIGSNMYLSKIAMDIVAKRLPPDEDGVRIAELDEMSYRRQLWHHRPLTDFWRVGKGYAKKLEAHGLFTMGDIARCSLGGAGEYHNEDLLYKLFGVNAELLIDHAWGWEPTTIADVKAYQPMSKSICSGQVLQTPYSYEKARLVAWEMADQLALDLVDKRLVTDQLVLTIGYDVENLNDPARRRRYKGDITTDHYGRRLPKKAHGTENLKRPTSSAKQLTEAILTLFDRIVDEHLLVRRLNISANHLSDENANPADDAPEQLTLFSDTVTQGPANDTEHDALEKERKLQETMLDLKKRFGKNAVLKATNLKDGATAMDRNDRIGGHKA